MSTTAVASFPPGVRYYDPSTGRFLTRDPIEAITRSAYGYVYGNPLNATDPSGLFRIPGTDWCVDIADPNCDNSATQEAAGQAYAGMAQALTLGHGEEAMRATGAVMERVGAVDKGTTDRAIAGIDRNSGWYSAGYLTGSVTVAGFAWASASQYGILSTVSSAGSMITSCRPGTWGTCAMSAGGLAAGLIPGFGLSSSITTPVRAGLSFMWGLGGNFGSYDDYCREAGRWVS